MIKKRVFQNAVLNWYDTNQRILPWRESRNPYHIWISEIMLQQTRVETVIPYYHNFLETIPTIEDLASADDNTLYKLWEGLGYYSRVRNLKKAANQIIDNFNGVMPQNRKDLESLSGIGPYSSGAISSIAFNKKCSAIDGNVLRIFARLYEIKTTIKDKDVKKQIKELVESLLPTKRIGDFNQGLMEIGATTCLPNGTPRCEVCPLKNMCISYKHQTMHEIPVKNKKKKIPSYKKTVLLLKYKNQYAIEKRPDKGLLASMYQFPLFESHLSIDEVTEYLNNKDITIEKINNSKHKFSHLEWNMIAYKVEVQQEVKDYLFVRKEDLVDTYTVPSAFKTYKEYIQRS